MHSVPAHCPLFMEPVAVIVIDSPAVTANPVSVHALVRLTGTIGDGVAATVGELDEPPPPQAASVVDTIAAMATRRKRKNKQPST